VAPPSTTQPLYDDGPYLESISDFVATSTDWLAAPAIGDCMARSSSQLPVAVKNLIVDRGMLGAVQQMDSLGALASSLGQVWSGCMAEGEQVVTTTLAPEATVPCQGSLTRLPFDLNVIQGVVPLGHLNPPEHTQPTDHHYFLLPGWANQNVASTPFVAPADGYLSDLASYSSESSGSMFTDWQMSVNVCANGYIKFGHVSTLSSELQALVDREPGTCSSYGYAGNMTEQCYWYGLNHVVSAGDLLGTAAGFDTPNSALDFWALDRSGPLHDVIDSSYEHGDARIAQCGLDWFADDLRTALYGRRLNFRGIVADAEVGCGKVIQDVAGTAKGLWYATVPIDGRWLDELALVDDNALGDHQVVSVASTVSNAGYWVFQKRSSGTVNRDFSQVTAGSGIHCYDTFTADSNGPSQGGADRFVIEVVDNSTLHIEHQSGSCSSVVSFQSPHVYSRYQK
jgi:hypothetical protein